MKKTITLLLPLILLAACEKNNHKTSYTFPLPPYEGQAVRYTNVYADANIEGDYDQQSDIVQYVSFTEGGTYLLCRKVEEPLSGGVGHVSKKYKTTYTAGRYSIDAEGIYQLYGYGTVKKSGTKAQPDEELTFTPTEGQPFTIPCSIHTPSEQSNDIFRQWKVASTRVRLSGDMSLAADFDGCDINQVCTFLKNNGLITHDTFPEGQKITLVDVSALGEITVLYENGNVDHATLTECSISALHYEWKDPGMGYGFETGRATIDYDGDTCILSLSGQFTGNGKTVGIDLIWALKVNNLK